MLRPTPEPEVETALIEQHHTGGAKPNGDSRWMKLQSTHLTPKQQGLPTCDEAGPLVGDQVVRNHLDLLQPICLAGACLW